MAGVGKPPHPSDGRDGRPVAGVIFVTDQKRMSTAADTVTRIDAAHMAHSPDLGCDRRAAQSWLASHERSKPAIVRLGGAVDFTVGASLPISGLTAWQRLFVHGQVQAGQSVLVHGAAGGSVASICCSMSLAATSGRGPPPGFGLGARW
jgi:hypothetical protein